MKFNQDGICAAKKGDYAGGIAWYDNINDYFLHEYEISPSSFIILGVDFRIPQDILMIVNFILLDYFHQKQTMIKYLESRNNLIQKSEND